LNYTIVIGEYFSLKLPPEIVSTDVEGNEIFIEGVGYDLLKFQEHKN
jgi:hypothetical protein